ncbi:hypothetical protein [Phocaeicola dorei]|uniref:hypothetical protein n=1 Tax=Phocaeicola dorei TaxID=357276 RepID=UPI001920A794|nr:hypothetical protein [Phocaeicola dorei]
MNLAFFKELGTAIVKHFSKNGPTYAKVFGGMVFASAVTAAACHVAYKKLEDKHRKEDAEKYKAEFTKRLKELEKRYQHNEYLLKKKINELCEEFGIEHVC